MAKTRTVKQREYFVQMMAKQPDGSPWQIAHTESASTDADKNCRAWIRDNAKDGQIYRICRVVTDPVTPEIKTQTILRPVKGGSA